MNTNMKENNKKEGNVTELNLDELEQVSGGILAIALGIGTLALGGALVYVYKKWL